ncbi:MAG: PAS domain S-box protein, partial [Proteobacteria bacterium]
MSLPVYRILLIEDHSADYLILKDLLADITTAEFVLDWVASFDAAISALDREIFDVCLLDYGLEGRTGLDLLEKVRSQSTVPFIVITGSDDYRIDAAVANAGAVDYLLKKDLTCRALERAIRYAVQRKAIETSLDQARKISQSIVNTLPDSIAVLDKGGKIVTVNAAWKEMGDPHPFPSSKLEVGTDFLRYCNNFGSACMAEIASGLEAMLENPFSEKPFFVEYAYECAQGEGCWLELRATPVHDSTPPLIVVAIKDITERKRGEVRLKTSAANLQQAQRMASLGSWELEVAPGSKGMAGRRYWSDETFRILGYSPREVEPTYDNFIRVFHPDDVESFEAEVEKATNDKRPCALDHRIVLSDGTERFVQERIDPILNDAGELVKFVGTIQDITPRKQAEEQLRFQQTLLEAQTEASLDGILVVSDEAKILSYNNRFVQLWDIPPEVVALKNDVPVLQAVTHRLL